MNLKLLPPEINFDDIDILKVLNLASRSLAELKGESHSIPNIDILINTLVLQESKESSEIENIITTQDDLFKSQIDNTFGNIAAKEVRLYNDALAHGFKLINQSGLLTLNYILEIQAILEPNKIGLRKIPGTVLKNQLGETVYTPPQHPDEILMYMADLDKYINMPELHEVDPLIKMAIIHHQFESIHPFYDGNGRTGRILNILYLVYMNLLDIPVLYLSRYINQNRAEYYNLLQEVRLNNLWKEWVIWILNGIHITSQHTIRIIRQMTSLMLEDKDNIEQNANEIYSKDLLESMFKHPYTKIKFIESDLGVHRQTATKYLDKLVDLNILTPVKIGRNKYYIHERLFNLLSNIDKV